MTQSFNEPKLTLGKYSRTYLDTVLDKNKNVILKKPVFF